MKGFLVAIQFVVAIFLIFGILLQTPKASGLGGTIGGGGDVGGGYRRRRGIERSLTKVSVVLIGFWVVVSVLITYLSR